MPTIALPTGTGTLETYALGTPRDFPKATPPFPRVALAAASLRRVVENQLEKGNGGGDFFAVGEINTQFHGSNLSKVGKGVAGYVVPKYTLLA